MNFENAAQRQTVQRFGKVIQLYAPLYLSNECIDTCLYCGFSRPNKIERRTLSVDEVLREADILTGQGFQHLLLVAGEHPKKVSPSFISALAEKLKPKVASLNIEIAPFCTPDYEKMIAAGIDGIVLYQETYDRETYERVHVGGPKKDYAHRLQFAEEACRSGIRTLGIGVLLGLSPWEEEIRALIRHARYLMNKYWQTEIRISLPRLRPCASDFQAAYPVSDDDFVKIICRLRLALPEAGIVLSTREKPALRERLINLGITHMSAGSRTEPGGYAHPDVAGKQFELEDHRTPAEVARAIERAGYQPVWKDWIG